jgi:hypothetical protein
MKYTERLKLLIATEIMFIAVLTSLFILAEKDLLHSFVLMLLIILLVGGACVAASFYAERGECRKWRRIWKDPTWQLVGYIVLGIALIASLWILPDFKYFNDSIWILIMGNSLIRDIRYYRNAVRYGMDDLKDVNDLANKYPEARPMINRKQKTDMENE